MINDVASEIDNIHSEKERAKFVDKTSVVTGEKRKPIDKNSSSTKKKRKKIVKCKWCNSTTHKTKRSKKCPYFGSNASAPAPVPAAKKKVTTPAPPPAVETNTTAPATPPATGEDVTAPEPLPASGPPEPSVTHQLGANVLAKWGRSWYFSHVCRVQGQGNSAVYDVYCPVAKTVQKNLDSTQVRVFDKPTVPTRDDFVKRGVTFFYEGDEDISPSTWKVTAVRHTENEFQCVRVSPDDATGPPIDHFSIGYVCQVVREQYEKRRELGPCF